MKEKNQNKTKIGMGSVVKETVGFTEENTNEKIIRRIRKDVVGCVHDVVAKKRFLLQL